MRKRKNLFGKIVDYIQRNLFLGILLLLLVVGTLAFASYHIIYAFSVANQQEIYDLVWDMARYVGKDIRIRRTEIIDLQIAEPVREVSETEEDGLFLSVEEFLEIGDNRDKYSVYLTGEMLDFNVLLEYNSDIIAYLYIPDTMVSYPIMQNMDNSYYLDHNIDGSEGYPGCLFVETYNSSDMEDSVNIIYGHNMSNDSMFGTLNEYDSEEYRAQHPYFLLYKPDGVQIYEVVIASAYSNEHLLSDCFTRLESGGYMFQGLNDEETLNFVARIIEYDAWGAYINAEAISVEDQLLVLSTCANGDVRYIVAGRRIV